jgi:monothiol glutaredoxin
MAQEMVQDVTERIHSAVTRNKVMIFMKGTANFPQCGFSAATVGVFQEMGVPFETADVLSDPELRDAIKR